MAAFRPRYDRRVPHDPGDGRAALARLYDLDLTDDPGDLDLYLALAARAGGPVLELAAGSGRVAVPLAAAGHTVTAVDIDPAMLTRGRAAAAAAGRAVARRVTWVEADLVGLRLPDAGSHAFGFIALNSLLSLGTRHAQRAAFTTLAGHVRPGGVVAVDVWQPDVDDLARWDGRLILEWTRTDPETGEQVTKVGSVQHDPPAQAVTVTSIFESSVQGGSARRWIRTDRLRLLSADELAGMAEEAGLRVETVAGGYGLEPLGSGGDRAVLVAVRP